MMKEMTTGTPKKHGHHERQRMFPGVRGRAPQNKKGRQADALVRQAAWDKLTLAQKLASLDSGTTLGGDRRNSGNSKRQRERIQSALDNPRAMASQKPVVQDQAKDTSSEARLTAKAQHIAERAKRPGHNDRG